LNEANTRRKKGKIMSNHLKENQTLRTELKRDVFDQLQGRQGNPRLRWYMERSDGDYEDAAGAIVSAAEIETKAGIFVFIEERA
jgi:hypothetical protein